MGRRFGIKPSRLRSASDDMHGQSRQAAQVGYEILEISRILRGMSGMEEVCWLLGRISAEVGQEADLVGRMSDSALRISLAYDKTENEVSIHGERGRQKFPVHRITAWKQGGTQVGLTWLKGLK